NGTAALPLSRVGHVRDHGRHVRRCRVDAAIGRDPLRRAALVKVWLARNRALACSAQGSSAALVDRVAREIQRLPTQLAELDRPDARALTPVWTAPKTELRRRQLHRGLDRSLTTHGRGKREQGEVVVRGPPGLPSRSDAYGRDIGEAERKISVVARRGDQD